MAIAKRCSLIGVRFDEPDWACFAPADLYVTEAWDYRVKLETALARGVDLEELEGELSQARLGQGPPTA